MSTAATLTFEEVKTRIHATEKDGGPTTYRDLAPGYEAVFEQVEWVGYQSIITKWLEHYSSESLQTQAASGRKHKILDAGCGTGLLGEYMSTVVPMDNVELYGGDITPEMIEQAKMKKNAGYMDFKIINLKKELPYEEEYFDSIVSSGVFYIAHCGPDCLPNIVRVLKKNGIFVTTSRKTFYEETKEDWEKYIRESNCTLLEAVDIPYHMLAKGTSLVIRKN